MKQIKGALFDLDGVLIDSETLYTEFWAEVGRHHHLPSPTFAYDIKGTTLNDILTTYFPEPEVRNDIDRLLHEFENEIVYPVQTAIVTSSDTKKMDFLFNQHPGFPSHFDAIVTAADVANSKPHPEPYLRGAEKAGVEVTDCIVFEDSFQGLESGRSAGARLVALSTTNTAESLLGKAHLVTDSLASLRWDDLLTL